MALIPFGPKSEVPAINKVLFPYWDCSKVSHFFTSSLIASDTISCNITLHRLSGSKLGKASKAISKFGKCVIKSSQPSVPMNRFRIWSDCIFVNFGRVSTKLISSPLRWRELSWLELFPNIFPDLIVVYIWQIELPCFLMPSQAQVRRL